MRRFSKPVILILLSAFWAVPAHASAPPPAALAKMTAWSMFLGADWVVKSVMLMLVLASVITWGICIGKYVEFRKTLRAMCADKQKIAEASTLASVPELGSPISSLILGTAKDEFGCCVDHSNSRSADAMTERLSIRLAAAETEAVQTMRSGFSWLASIGATAPFIGLFGTVWGIMNSFIGISQAQTTNLAVVAPGIAEALLATALGLVAAIPAVLLYNVFSRRMAGFRRHLQDISTRIACLVSREVEQTQVGHLKIAV